MEFFFTLKLKHRSNRLGHNYEGWVINYYFVIIYNNCAYGFIKAATQRQNGVNKVFY